MQLLQLPEMIERLERQLEELNFEIEQYLDKMGTFVTTFPGLGKVLGADILGEIGDISRFNKLKSWLFS